VSPGPPPALVLVTGATGFVGSEVARRLGAHGHAVHALARASSARASLDGLGVVWHEGDLEDAASLARACTGAARAAQRSGRAFDVLHCAARISYRRADAELLRRTNVEGTRAVLAACGASGVRRLCHVSSVVALGAVEDPALELDDDAPLGGLTLDSAYARTKAQAEELVLAARAELDVVVASPAVVFGESEAGSNSQHFLARARRGAFGPLSPPGSLTVVGLSDTAAGIVAVLERGARGRRYLLAESSWRLHELLDLVARAVGRRGPPAVMPRVLWGALAAGAALLERVRPAERATPEALRLLGLHFRFRARRARAELSWTPRPFAEVLAEIVRAKGAGAAPGARR